MEDVPIIAIPFFSAFTPEEHATLLRHVDAVERPRGTILFEAGDPGDSLYVIRKGEVEIYLQDATGQRIVLETCREHDFFGELSLLDGGPRTASAMVSKDLSAIRIDRADLDALVIAHPTAALDLLAATGRRLRQSGDLLRASASRNANQEIADTRTRLERVADWIAEFSGSISFLLLHVVAFAVWIGINVTWPVAWMPKMPVFDPYPFGFLTMVVSLEAIILSVFVLLSQNRQVAKDRIRSDIEYEVNLKAELEVAHLHEKIDHLTGKLLGRLEAIEKVVRPPPR